MSLASRPSLEVVAGVVFGVVLASCIRAYYPSLPSKTQEDLIVDGVAGLVGKTPLVRIKSLSEALGVEILGKAEFLNPGGSVKDRVALQIIDDAEAQGLLEPRTGCRIFEGTVGSTGISLATLAAARGYDATIIMPDDVAAEKALALHALGATIEIVRPASIVDKKQFVNLAKSRAKDFTLVHGHPIEDEDSSKTSPRGYFADQFENLSNFRAHYNGTAPEIWRQTSGRIDAFISGAGTGGTLAGIGSFLKHKHPGILVVLADPEGSGLFNKVKSGVMFDPKESELGTRRRRHQVDTVVEGIGINRLTKNFEQALPIVDDAIRVTDAEAVSMSRYIVKHDGLFLGSSSACNLVAAVRVARQTHEGGRIVTILCDSGSRHYSKFWNDEFLAGIGIDPDVTITEQLLKAK